MSMLAAEVICLVAIILVGVAVSVLAGLMIERTERRVYERRAKGTKHPALQAPGLEAKENTTYPP